MPIDPKERFPIKEAMPLQSVCGAGGMGECGVQAIQSMGAPAQIISPSPGPGGL